MTSVLRKSTHALLLAGVVFIGLPEVGQAQDPCPSASVVEAEAGWTAYQAGDMGEARSRFTGAIARCDNDHYARTGLGYVELRAGNTTAAAELMAVVVRAEPNNVDALVGLGLANWRTADLDGVRRNFERVVQLAPDHPTALEYLVRVAGAEAEATRPAGPEDPADQAWSDGDADLAMRLYSERLDADALDGVAMLRVGLMHAWDGRYRAAFELLNLLVDLEPTNAGARVARARVFAWSGDVAAAQDEVFQVLEAQPDNADALAALALFQAWSGQLDEALASYDELLSISPDHGAGRRQQAQAMAWAAQQEQSLVAYRSLVEANPDDVVARVGLATALGFAGEFDEAIYQYDQALLRSPEEMRALAGKAKVLGWAGRLIESERAALRAVDVDRASADAWASLGQVYRWQGRNAAALEAFEVAVRFAPTNPEIRDQLRSVNLSLAPVARPTFTAENDSDGNSMLTTSIAANLHATPRFDVRASGYYRQLEQTFDNGRLERTAAGGTVRASYQIRPGWLVSGGLGGSLTDGSDDPIFLSFSGGVRTPERFPFGLGLNVSSNGLDETAALAERGVRASEVLVSARWNPAPLWRVDGNFTQGQYDGTEKNGRRGGYFGASRRLGRFFSLGASFRGFSFEKNLNDGYFDPDFYGVAELTSYWLYRPVPWTFLIEVAPGVQQVTRDGDPGSSLRTNARVAYRIGQGRELSVSFGYSSAGLTSFATGTEGYSYTALIVGLNWIF